MSEQKKLPLRIKELEQENKKLKRQLSQYKKYVAKSTELIIDNYESYNKSEDIVEHKKDKISICTNCGKGNLKKIKILDFIFEICGICNFRKKIK